MCRTRAQDLRELLEASDKLVQQLRDHATLTVDDNSFEWLEDFNARAGTDDDKIEWLSAAAVLYAYGMRYIVLSNRN